MPGAPLPFPTFETPDGAQPRAGRRLAVSLVALSVFMAWQAVVVRRFVRLDTRPPAWDQAVHLEIALDYRDAIARGRWSDVWNLAPKPGMPPFPPLYHLAIMRAYGSSDPAHAALWANWAYMCALALSLFGLIFEFRRDAVAVAGVVAFCCAPAVQSLMTTQLIDLSVVACAAAAYWALVRSDDFKRWPGSLAFGALFAVGMMHKWSFFSYMIPAYLLAAKALGDKRSLWKVLASAALALAGFLPWYERHAGVLVPRLFQASSDFAVPVWHGAAFFNYLLACVDGLGPVFWVFAWIGLLVPNYKDNEDKGWLVWSSVALSYVFWTIVPNRQLRFLLPGLPGLAVAFCGAWPDPLIWTVAAVQLAVAINFAGGWIPSFPLNLGLVSMTLFPSSAPKHEDWKLPEILLEIDKRIDASAPFANVTLVANAPTFNGPTLTWERKRLGLARVNIRGVNSRLCEFSSFVLLKDGQLGPDSVIGGLPEAAKIIGDKDGWFPRAYEDAGRWDLPDGTHAVLYAQRRFAASPFKSKATSFAFYENGPFSAQEFKAELGAWNAARGVYPLARVSASEATLRGLRVVRPDLEFEDALLVPAGDVKKSEWDDIRFLRMKRLRVRGAVIEANDLRAFIEARAKGFIVSKLELDKTIRLDGAYKNASVSAEASVELRDAPRRLVVSVLAARVRGAAIPAALLGSYSSFVLPLEPTPDLPFFVDIPGVTLKDGKLSIP